MPDETSFDDEPTEIATSSSVEVQAYKPVEFVTDVSFLTHHCKLIALADRQIYRLYATRKSS